MAERARKLRLKLKKEKEEQKVEEHKEEPNVNVHMNESKQNMKQSIIQFKKIELSDDEDKGSSDDSSYFEPTGRNNAFPRSKTPILRKSQKLSKEMDVDNDEMEPLTFLNDLNNKSNNEYQIPQVDLGFDLDKLLSGNVNNNEELSVTNNSLNNSNINQSFIHEMPKMQLSLMDIMQARFNLKKTDIRNSRKIKSSIKQTNTNNENDNNNINQLKKLSPNKTKVSKLLIEKGWNKNLHEMINQKVEELKLLPGYNVNSKINDILDKRKRMKYLFENDPDVMVIKGENYEFKRKKYNVDLVSIMKQSIKNDNKL